MTFDPIGQLGVLQDSGVEFVVIGGIAAAAHGSPTGTVDLDICYSRDSDNLERLSSALRSLDARLRGVDDEVPFLLEAKTLEAGDHFTLTTRLGDLDLIGTPAGTSGYDELRRGAVVVDLDGIVLAIASLPHLVRMKQAAGRPKDRAELEILGALQDEVGERTSRDSPG